MKAMKHGAYDYLFKPLGLHQLRRVVDEGQLEVARRMRVPAKVVQTVADPDVEGAILGRLPGHVRGLQGHRARRRPRRHRAHHRRERHRQRTRRRAIYQHHSARAGVTFLALNCAAVARTACWRASCSGTRRALHGRERRRIGKFEQCNGGTSSWTRSATCRAGSRPSFCESCRSRPFERVGGNATVRTDVRLIAATHRDLKGWLEQGRFRADLYYRLSAFTVDLPPLRDRGDDLPTPGGTLPSALSPMSLSRDVRDLPAETLGSRRRPIAGRATSGSCRAF